MLPCRCWEPYPGPPERAASPLNHLATFAAQAYFLLIYFLKKRFIFILCIYEFVCTVCLGQKTLLETLELELQMKKGVLGAEFRFHLSSLSFKVLTFAIIPDRLHLDGEFSF